jgi:hypothetical protein
MERLTPIEIRQIVDLKKVYGVHNVLIAIQYAKSTQIKDVGRMLLQHCGFRSNLAESLNGIIPDKATAQKMFPPEKYLIGCRLEEATQPVEFDVEKDTKNLISLWKSKTGLETDLPVIVENAIRGAIRKYGMAFAKSGIEIILNKRSHLTQETVAKYQAWLELASTQSHIKIVEMLSELGISPDNYKLEIPQPIPLRLEKYFIAKANRYPTQEEKAHLWSKLRKRKLDEIVHVMSCVPSSDFSIEKIERVLNLTEPFGAEFVASINNNAKGQKVQEDEQNEDDRDIEEYDFGEPQSPPDPMRDSEFYDYSRYDENALDGDDYLDDYSFDDEEW